jgi:hypothetical protein
MQRKEGHKCRFNRRREEKYPKQTQKKNYQTIPLIYFNPYGLGMTIPIYVVVFMLNLLEIHKRLQNTG